MPDYKIPGVRSGGLSDEQISMIEHTAKNFFDFRGSCMKIPPRLYSDLKASGCSMKYIEADASLEQ